MAQRNYPAYATGPSPPGPEPQQQVRELRAEFYQRLHSLPIHGPDGTPSPPPHGVAHDGYAPAAGRTSPRASPPHYPAAAPDRPHYPALYPEPHHEAFVPPPPLGHDGSRQPGAAVHDPLLAHALRAAPEQFHQRHPASPVHRGGASPTAAGHSPTAAGGAPAPRALLVGITYRGQGARELEGCSNDAAAMAAFLAAQGWQDVRRLTEELGDNDPALQPTRRNLLEGLRWLTAGAAPGQALFFFFSGHAMPVADVSGDEADGFDEALVTLDGFAVTDDALFDLLVRPLPAGCRLTAVADCCHSGTLLDLPHNYGVTAGGAVHAHPRRSGRYRPGARAEVLLISACRDEEQAADAGAGPAPATGACTAALLSLLHEEGPALAYDQLLDGLWRRLVRFGPQLPQLSATLPLSLREDTFALLPGGAPLLPVPRLVALADADGDGLPDSPARVRGKAWGFSFAGLQSAITSAAPVVSAALAGGGATGGGGAGALLATAAQQVAAFVPSLAQIAQALKDALLEGIQWAIARLSAPGGFLHDLRVRIAWPAEMRQVEGALRQFGFDQQCDQFVEVLNRAAEDATAGGVTVFSTCLREMTIDEAKRILDGKDSEATTYMRSKTTGPLTSMMAPLVNNALEQNTVTKYWDDLLAIYNNIPFLPRKQFDLGAYTVGRALNGVFLLIAEKEAQLRADPAGAASQLAQNVLQWKRDGCPE